MNRGAKIDLFYVLHEEDTDCFKPGHGNPWDRRDACQTGNSKRLELVHIDLGGELLEKFILERTKDRGTSGGTEFRRWESADQMRRDCRQYADELRDIKHAHPKLNGATLAMLAKRLARPSLCDTDQPS